MWNTIHLNGTNVQILVHLVEKCGVTGSVDVLSLWSINSNSSHIVQLVGSFNIILKGCTPKGWYRPTLVEIWSEFSKKLTAYDGMTTDDERWQSHMTLWVRSAKNEIKLFGWSYLIKGILPSCDCSNECTWGPNILMVIMTLGNIQLLTASAYMILPSGQCIVHAGCSKTSGIWCILNWKRTVREQHVSL